MSQYALFSGYGNLCVLILFAIAADAQVTRFENRPIADIQYSPAVNLDANDLARAVKLRKGEAYRAEEIAASVDGLFATGRFTDIVVEAEPSANGVIVRFVTQAAWFVGGIAVQGKVVSPPNRAQIESAAPLTLGAPFHDEDLANAVDAVKEVLKNNGLYEAEVTTELARDPGAQQIFVTIKVAEHKRAKYERPALLAAAPPDASADRATPPPQTFQQMGESAIVSKGLADPIANRLQRVFGVSQLSIDPTFTGASALPEAQVTLQQRISSSMTFSYTTALDNPNSQIVTVQWALNPQWSAIAGRDQNGVVSVRLLYQKQFR